MIREVVLEIVVVLAEKLHSHHGEDEDDDAQNECKVAERANRTHDNPHQEIQRGPRFGQLENTELEKG